ncbi:hypothetical protein LSH36_142g03013 [Paralvinella palmiformis]|uniref:Essential MCU regulator, mitochondrial n=1 Tax=Paralvinella palmiformis TaxID=53620 RepID=A0AAD9NAE9_9ANNE|nr:hypothetical protein LSH36_142g03013 [Paralvinella palmiformis]
MATRLGCVGQSVRQIFKAPVINHVNIAQRRTAIYAESGAVLPKPDQIKFPLPKVLITVIPFLTTGAIVSKNGAAILEEMEIFVPEDDDD